MNGNVKLRSFLYINSYLEYSFFFLCVLQISFMPIVDDPTKYKFNVIAAILGANSMIKGSKNQSFTLLCTSLMNCQNVNV